MLVKFISICLSFLVICDANRCSYVTVPVCDNDVTISPGSLGTPRGAKGDQGPAGNLGPRGIPGFRGLKGEKGEVAQSDEGALQEIWEKVRELERIVTSILPLESRINSTSNGRTTLLIEDRWTVFQRRFNGSVDFYRNWTEYKNGFGDFSGEFWLGLERIHTLTYGKQCQLRIDLYDFNDAHAFAVYSSFSVGNEASNYRLLVAGYSGTAGDSLYYHNGMQFSTKDRNHDRSSGNCARYNHGAWWFNNCHYSHLNGEWARTSSGYNMNIVWYYWKGYYVALKASTMKLRCD